MSYRGLTPAVQRVLTEADAVVVPPSHGFRSPVGDIPGRCRGGPLPGRLWHVLRSGAPRLLPCRRLLRPQAITVCRVECFTVQ